METQQENGVVLQPDQPPTLLAKRVKKSPDTATDRPEPSKETFNALSDAQLHHIHGALTNLFPPAVAKAPITALPFEVLSEIFIICTIVTRIAPVVISAVCHRFRDVMISTPLAWSRIFPQNAHGNILPPAYLSMFLERSKPCLLHIRVPWASQDCECEGARTSIIPNCDCANVEVLLRNGHRLQCLFIEHHWLEELSKGDYPNLHKLTLIRYNRTTELPPGLLDMSRFTKLRYLILGRHWQLNSMIDLSSLRYPELTHLHLAVDKEDIWAKLIQKSSASLKSLRIHGDFRYTAAKRWKFHCPRLEILIVEEGPAKGVAEPRVLEFISPRLMTYEYFSEDEVVTVSPTGGVERVTHLTTNTVFPLSTYKQLRSIQLNINHLLLGGVLEQFEGNPHLCPELESIALFDDAGSIFELMAQERITNRNRTAGSKIQLNVFREWRDIVIWYYSHCNSTMPCYSKYQDI